MYSRAVEPLFIPGIWLAVPVVPNPVPPLVSGSAVARVNEEADNAPVNVPPPLALIPAPAQNLPLTPATPDTVNPVPTLRFPLTPRPPVIIVAPVVDVS